MEKFTIYNGENFPIGQVSKCYLKKFIDPIKEYNLKVPSPITGGEPSILTVKGEDLTENQMWQLFIQESI